MSVFGYIALFVAIFIIYNTFSIVITQRTRETALLRAIGARRRQVLAATMLEAVIVGLIAAIVGLIAGGAARRRSCIQARRHRSSPCATPIPPLTGRRGR